MSAISPKTKLTLFTILWGLLAIAFFGVSGMGAVPYILSGLTLLFLVVLWSDSENPTLKKAAFVGFIQLSVGYTFIFLVWAVFFGKHNPVQCALFAVGIVALFASCWLVKP